MDLRKIKKLIELLEDSALAEMEITEGENTIRLSRLSRAAPSQPLTPLAPPSAPPPAPTAATQPPPADSPPADEPVAGTVVESPLVGTFYSSRSPDEKPFVSVGSAVRTGDTLCLIEAMKTFNQLDAETDGVVSVIHKDNGDPVEYGEPLFVIESSHD